MLTNNLTEGYIRLNNNLIVKAIVSVTLGQLVNVSNFFGGRPLTTLDINGYVNETKRFL